MSCCLSVSRQSSSWPSSWEPCITSGTNPGMFPWWCYCYRSDLLWFSRYVPLDPDPTSDNILCSENSVVFQISIFQYVALAVFLSTAAPYRKPLYTNGREKGRELCTYIYWDHCVLSQSGSCWLSWFWFQSTSI